MLVAYNQLCYFLPEALHCIVIASLVPIFVFQLLVETHIILVARWAIVHDLLLVFLRQCREFRMRLPNQTCYVCLLFPLMHYFFLPSFEYLLNRIHPNSLHALLFIRVGPEEVLVFSAKEIVVLLEPLNKVLELAVKFVQVNALACWLLAVLCFDLRQIYFVYFYEQHHDVVQGLLCRSLCLCVLTDAFL